MRILVHTGSMALPALALAISLSTAGPSAAQPNRVIPVDTVVRAQLDQRLSSRSATRGQHFTATVADNDRSGFPEGTRLEGVVTEVHHPSADRPGVLDVSFRRAILPGGRAVAINGSLSGLDEKDVRETSDGRLISTHRDKGKLQTKWLGYGAAGGAVLSTIFGGSFFRGALLGALGGGAYAYLNRDKDHHEHYREVDLDPGTRFGVRLNRQAVFANAASYRYPSYDRGRDDRDHGDRDRDLEDSGRPEGDRERD